MAVVLKQAMDPLPRPGEFVSDLPQEVEKVLYKALAKDPENRYECMETFATAMEKLLWLPAESQTGSRIEKKTTHSDSSPTCAGTNSIRSGSHAG